MEREAFAQRREASAQRASLERSFDDERKRFMVLIGLLTAAVLILALTIAYTLLRRDKKKFSYPEIVAKEPTGELQTSTSMLGESLPAPAAQNVEHSIVAPQPADILDVQEGQQIATTPNQIKSSPTVNGTTRLVPHYVGSRQLRTPMQESGLKTRLYAAISPW